MSFTPVNTSPPPGDRFPRTGPAEFGAPPGMSGIGREVLHLERGHLAPGHNPEDLHEPEGHGIDTRILIGTSLTAFGEGLRPWLESSVRGWRVVAVCDTTGALDDAIGRHAPDVMLLTDELTPSPALPTLADHAPDLRIVVMSIAVSAAQEVALVRQGASAVIAASASRAQTVDAVEAVLGGRAVVSAAALKLLSGQEPEARELTRRQRDVLERLAMGRSTAQIAQELVVTPSTVKTHIKHLQKRFGVPGQQALVANARTLLSTSAATSLARPVSVEIVSRTI